jgi:hypothetical protein
MRPQKIKFWLFLSVMSFLVILLTMLLTSPIDKIGFAILFFAAFFGLLISLGHLLIYLRRRQLGPKTNGRIVIVSIFIVLLVMFRSAQSLSWVDALILLLVIGGLLFYSSRRGT